MAQEETSMTIYVDDLRHRGWILRGRATMNCHMFTDAVDLRELHEMALAIGMKRVWFQDKSSSSHYDLTASRRALAIERGALALDDRQAVDVWRALRKAVAELDAVPSRQE